MPSAQQTILLLHDDPNAIQLKRRFPGILRSCQVDLGSIGVRSVFLEAQIRPPAPVYARPDADEGFGRVGRRKAVHLRSDRFHGALAQAEPEWRRRLHEHGSLSVGMNGLLLKYLESQFKSSGTHRIVPSRPPHL